MLFVASPPSENRAIPEGARSHVYIVYLNLDRDELANTRRTRLVPPYWNGTLPALELELIEERRLTLPPGQLPWEWDQRRREARRREQRLGNARSKLRRARRRRVVATALTFGLWKHR